MYVDEINRFVNPDTALQLYITRENTNAKHGGTCNIILVTYLVSHGADFV